MAGYMPQAVTDLWSSPRDLIFNLKNEFDGFDLDPASTKENAVCERFYTEEDNGLELPYFGRNIYINPPYGNVLRDWVSKAWIECYSLKHCERVIMLLPVRSDTRWFHSIFEMGFAEMRLIKGRLKYGNSKTSAPFPSMILIFEQGNFNKSVVTCDKVGKLLN